MHYSTYNIHRQEGIPYKKPRYMPKNQSKCIVDDEIMNIIHKYLYIPVALTKMSL